MYTIATSGMRDYEAKTTVMRYLCVLREDSIAVNDQKFCSKDLTRRVKDEKQSDDSNEVRVDSYFCHGGVRLRAAMPIQAGAIRRFLLPTADLDNDVG